MKDLWLPAKCNKLPTHFVCAPDKGHGIVCRWQVVLSIDPGTELSWLVASVYRRQAEPVSTLHYKA
jgi:hypothetical protein